MDAAEAAAVVAVEDGVAAEEAGACKLQRIIPWRGPRHVDVCE